jgi:ATP-dependent Clp protease ATP-binding subunit ClpC
MQAQNTRLAQRVMRRARAETERLGVSYLGADSLLLGLLGERRCLANRALAALGLDLPRARQELETRASHAAYRQNRACPSIVSPILLRAREEAQAHGQACWNTAHLLLGVLHDSTSAAVQVLAAHGLAADAVRQALADAARQGAAAEGGRSKLLDPLTCSVSCAIRLPTAGWRASCSFRPR